MPWQNQGGGGPWGGGGGGGSWGGGRGSGPTGQPPNLEELLRKGQERVRQMLPGGFGSGRGFLLVILGIVAIWLASGFYRVQPDELGVVTRFGKYVGSAQPGLNYRLPWPVDSVTTPKVTRVNRVEVGFRSAGESASRADSQRQVPEEALMLTGDENIVDINFVVFWIIKDAGDYLFNVRRPEVIVKAAVEATMREILGRTPIASALAEGRRQIEASVKDILQAILDDYKAGIAVTQVQLQKVDPPSQVVDSFRDVQRARADQERLRNEAEAYRNDVIPRARGDGERIIQEAEAYKQEVLAHAQGEARRFIDVYEAYNVAREVTTRRIYIETMEEVLRGANKVIIDRPGEGGTGVVPYLPLPEIHRRATQPAAPGARKEPGR
ncbi:MAG: FtsH protease activity modulator HflK [Alphaproteobacteria bacterium]|nr:FtsH protease activity modulator HflK [Alphaproteobacteria bacterium]